MGIRYKFKKKVSIEWSELTTFQKLVVVFFLLPFSLSIFVVVFLGIIAISLLCYHFKIASYVLFGICGFSFVGITLPTGIVLFIYGVFLFYKLSKENEIENQKKEKMKPWTDFETAIIRNDFSTIRRLVEKKIFIDGKSLILMRDINNSNCLNLLHSSTAFENLLFLIQNGADVNNANYKGVTPLMSAFSKKFSFGHIKLLVDNGAKIEVSSNDGISIMKRAIRRNEKQIIDYFEQKKGTEMGDDLELNMINSNEVKINLVDENSFSSVHYSNEGKIDDLDI